MTDKKFQKQLEKFGIESTLKIEADERKQRQKEYTQDNIGVVKSIMDTIQGRRWMYSRLTAFGVHTTPFIAGKPDASAFLAGLQEAGHLLEDDVMQACPDRYFLMTQEAVAREVTKKED